MDDDAVLPGGQGPKKPQGLIRKLATWLVGSTRRMIRTAFVGIGLPVIVALIVSHLPAHRSREKTDFYGTIDLNVPEGTGAGVYDAANISRHAIGRRKDGHEVHFIGFCIGEAVRSVSTRLPDERWFILPNHTVIAAAQVDGGPPPASPPSKCAGGRKLPNVFGLKAREQAGTLILSAKSPGASLVGFAVRRNRTSRWYGLPLALEVGGKFSAKAGGPGAMAAIAVVCWDRGEPAHAEEPDEFIDEPVSLGNASRSLRRAASTTISEGARVACAPEAKPPHMPKIIRRHKTPSRPVKPPIESTPTTVKVVPIPAESQPAPTPAKMAKQEQIEEGEVRRAGSGNAG
jgi:hypothetical protein